MTKNKILTTFFLFLVWLALPNQIFSQYPSQVKTLAGFDTLKVVVEDLTPQMEQAGLTVEQIQTDVEIKLRKAGFKVKDKDAVFDPYIYLYTKVSSFKQDGNFAIDVKTTLNQRVLLERNKSIGNSSTTWETDYIGIAGEGYVRGIRDLISDQVDRFINDWLKANASTTSEKETPQSTYVPVPPPPKAKQQDSPFTATYVGGNRLPTVEIFNDTDRTIYFDFGQGRMTAYTIPSRGSQKINLSEAGNYKYKASAPRIRSDEGQATFNNGYVYTWRFYIVTVPR